MAFRKHSGKKQKRKHSGLLELIDSPYAKYLLKLFCVPPAVWESSDVKVK